MRAVEESPGAEEEGWQLIENRDETGNSASEVWFEVRHKYQRPFF